MERTGTVQLAPLNTLWTPLGQAPNCYPFSARADTPQPLMDLSGWWVQAYGSVRQPLKEQTPSTLCGERSPRSAQMPLVNDSLLTPHKNNYP